MFMFRFIDVATILKFAIMEFKIGEAQRGGTIFESLLKNYPKKTDLWSIYIDMWTREQDFDQVRYQNCIFYLVMGGEGVGCCFLF